LIALKAAGHWMLALMTFDLPDRVHRDLKIYIPFLFAKVRIARHGGNPMANNLTADNKSAVTDVSDPMRDQKKRHRVGKAKGRANAKTTTLNWSIECNRTTFEKCRGDRKFPYIVMLARAVNAFNFVHSAMIHSGEGDDPEAQRDRLNSYFFASALLYESLRLIRAMNKTFMHDDKFQNGLRRFLRDKTACRIERAHLDPARNGAVFHFLPEPFTAMINSATVDNCLFLTAGGKKKKDVYYNFADVITTEILVGSASNEEDFYAALRKAMVDTRDLAFRFTNEAEHLISYYLKNWGFGIKEKPSG